MCGIAGVYSYGLPARPAPRTFVERALGQMAARGPDGAGTWAAPDGAVVLGHRRLAILDPTPAGAQPMATDDGRYTVVYNGEVYNHRALWAQEGRQGGALRSGSDTEVLLRLFARHGPAVLRHLRGMYAFAIWDDLRRELFLARDPHGIKPLYYADGGSAFRFASQVRALVAGGGADTERDPAGQAGFFLWGFVPEPYTLFRGIRALPAGAWMRVGADGVEGPVRSADTESIFAGARAPRGSVSGAVGEAVRDSVRHHLVADVDVGVFLSGGVDSTTLAALACEVGAPPRSVTLGVTERRGTSLDEVPLAEAVAARLGLRHTTVWVGQRDFDGAYEAVLAAMDQPSTDGVNTYLVSAAAAAVGLKTVLSGLGADELFGGYTGFGWLRLAARLPRPLPVPAALGRGSRQALARLLDGRLSPKAAGVVEYGTGLPGAYLLRRSLYMPWELPDLIGREAAEAGLAELARTSPFAALARAVRPGQRVPALETSWYLRGQLLRDADWASMAHSVEVRLPLVDAEVLRAVAPHLTRAVSKHVLVGIPRQPLPPALLAPKKLGFTVPLREWAGGRIDAARGLRGWARHVYRHYTATVGTP